MRLILIEVAMYFKVPSDFVYSDTYKFNKGNETEKKLNQGFVGSPNLEHGRRTKFYH